MPWAKLHTDILGDPKLMRASRKGAKGLLLTPWFIAFAKEADDDGRLTVNGEPAEPVDMASLIPNTTARGVSEAQSSLRRLGVLVQDEDGALRFAAWEKRSGGGKPSDRPESVLERVHRHRRGKVKRDTPESETPTVTPHRNALQNENGNATEVEVEVEKEQSQKRGSRGKRGGLGKKWLAPFIEAWRERYGGELAPGQAAKALSQLCFDHSGPEVLRRWRIYLAATEAPYASPAKFSQTFGQWGETPVPKRPAPNGAHPATDADRLEALEVLSKLRASITTDGRARFVDPAVVNSLSTNAQRALKAIGGGPRIVNAPDKDWGFLEHTFVQAYLGAQEKAP